MVHGSWSPLNRCLLDKVSGCGVESQGIQDKINILLTNTGPIRAPALRTHVPPTPRTLTAAWHAQRGGKPTLHRYTYRALGLHRATIAVQLGDASTTQQHTYDALVYYNSWALAVHAPTGVFWILPRRCTLSRLRA